MYRLDRDAVAQADLGQRLGEVPLMLPLKPPLMSDLSERWELDGGDGPPRPPRKPWLLSRLLIKIAGAAKVTGILRKCNRRNTRIATFDYARKLAAKRHGLDAPYWRPPRVSEAVLREAVARLVYTTEPERKEDTTMADNGNAKALRAAGAQPAQLGELSLELLCDHEAGTYAVVDPRRDIELARGKTKGAALHNWLKGTREAALRLAEVPD